MRPDVRTLRRESRDRANLARAVSRLVASEAFAEAFDRDGDDAEAVTAMVRSLDKEGLECWMRRRVVGREVGALSLRELRAVGQKLGVRSYNRLPKASLLSEIVNATERSAS
jgi:hypothetical protein